MATGISFSSSAPAVPVAPEIEIAVPDAMDGMDMGG